MNERNSNEAQDTMKFKVPPEERKKYTNSSQTNNQPKSKPQNTASKKKQTPPKKKKSPFVRLIRRLIAIAVVLFVGYSGIVLNYISKINVIENENKYVNDETTLMFSSKVKNILIIGTDARDPSSRGLSDSMIMLSLNEKKHAVQMTSFMRDMYTEIDDYGSDKLNAAYSYGGAELLKDTIEDNFKIRIDGCITLNFAAVAYIVDAMGGVEITISDEEAEAINTILCSEVNEIMGDDSHSDFLSGAGTYKLNGKQALSYSRIRYVGDADFERTQRQRTVITKLMGNFKKINPVKFNKYIKKALSNMGTDMEMTELYFTSLQAPKILAGYNIQQLRVPCDNSWWYDETWDGQSIIGVDFASNTQYLKEQLYMSNNNTK